MYYFPKINKRKEGVPYKVEKNVKWNVKMEKNVKINRRTPCSKIVKKSLCKIGFTRSSHIMALLGDYKTMEMKSELL